jgi:two-component system, LytTR family, response regulator
MTVRAAILDDEHIIATDLARQIARHPGWEVAGAFTDCDELQNCIDTQQIDVCFMDIEMPGRNGLTFARELREQMPDMGFVFVTAYHQYAAAAFRVEAIDYLVKPATPDAVAEACRRAEERVGAPGQSAKFAVISAGRIDYVALNDIIAAKAAGNYVALLTNEAEHLHRVTISELDETLAGAGFLRTHRSHLVRPSAIVSARVRGDDILEVTLANGATAPVSDTYRSRVAASLRSFAIRRRSEN